MGIFSFLFGNKKKKAKFEDKAKVENENTQIIEIDEDNARDKSKVESAESENTEAIKIDMDTARDNTDIGDGMKFHATHQLSTPLWILKKNGEVYKGNEDHPEYGTQADGCWSLNTKEEDKDEPALGTDAGVVNSDLYLNYVIGLKTIFDNDSDIHEKMSLALKYANTEPLKEIENKLLAGRNGSIVEGATIADVMSKFITPDECLAYFSDKKGYLHLIDGVNKTITNSLIDSGITTIIELKAIDHAELLKIKGIGKVSGEKIKKALQSKFIP